jgi:hypothetical protein
MVGVMLEVIATTWQMWLGSKVNTITTNARRPCDTDGDVFVLTTDRDRFRYRDHASHRALLCDRSQSPRDSRNHVVVLQHGQ